MSDPDSNLVFQFLPRHIRRSALGEYAGELRKRVARGRSFVCLFTNNRELRRLNREFRGKDEPTDVLSFPSGQQKGNLGDIAISVERAAKQAAERGHRLETELRILMLHGVLHLKGLDHERDGGRMARAETRWRRALGLPDGLIERARR